MANIFHLENFIVYSGFYAFVVFGGNIRPDSKLYYIRIKTDPENKNKSDDVQTKNHCLE